MKYSVPSLLRGLSFAASVHRGIFFDWLRITSRIVCGSHEASSPSPPARLLLSESNDHDPVLISDDEALLEQT